MLTLTTFALALLVMVITTVVALRLHGWKFFSYFVPSGVPKLLLPLLVPIEILSYLSRLVSLSVRLFANMMAGHVMLEVFGAFIVMLGAAGRMHARVQQAEARDPLRRTPPDLERHAASHRMARQREAFRRRHQHLVGHRAEAREAGKGDDVHVRHVREPRGHIGPDRFIAEQSARQK